VIPLIVASLNLQLSLLTISKSCNKNQSKVEKGFRFIKDKSFRVSEVYLKKPQRIEALSMVMVLTLMVYSVAEWKLRERLKINRGNNT
jgi:transposase